MDSVKQGYVHRGVFEKVALWFGLLVLAPIAVWLLVIGVNGVLALLYHSVLS